MTPYIIAYVYYFAIVFIAHGSRHLRAWWFVASVPLIGLVLLRGLVGVDMLTYMTFIDHIRDVGTYTFTFEPLFEYLALFLAVGFDNSSVVLAILAALTTVLLYWGASGFEQEPYLFTYVVIPYFYLDMTMNGIRYGLSFAVIVFGIHFLVSGNRIVYLLFVIVASLIQISGGLLAIVFMLLVEMRWRAVLYTTIFGVAIYPLFADYLQLKLADYSSFEIYSPTAGLAPFFLSGSVLIIFWFDKGFRQIAWVQVLALGVFAILAYVITQFSYAGLRFQQLILFLICIVIASTIKSEQIRIERKTILLIILIGLIGSGFRLKNFYDNSGQGDTPFAPYYFFWDR